MKKTSIIILAVVLGAMILGCGFTDRIVEEAENKVREEVNNTIGDLMDGFTEGFSEDYQDIVDQIQQGMSELQSLGDEAGLWDAEGGTFQPSARDEGDRTYLAEDGEYLKVTMEDGKYVSFKQYNTDDDLIWNCDWPATVYDELTPVRHTTSCDPDTCQGYETVLYVNVVMGDPVDSNHLVYLTVTDESVALYHVDRIQGTDCCPDLRRINTKVYYRL